MTAPPDTPEKSRAPKFASALILLGALLVLAGTVMLQVFGAPGLAFAVLLGIIIMGGAVGSLLTNISKGRSAGETCTERRYLTSGFAKATLNHHEGGLALAPAVVIVGFCGFIGLWLLLAGAVAIFSAWTIGPRVIPLVLLISIPMPVLIAMIYDATLLKGFCRRDLRKRGAEATGIFVEVVPWNSRTSFSKMDDAADVGFIEMADKKLSFRGSNSSWEIPADSILEVTFARRSAISFRPFVIIVVAAQDGPRELVFTVRGSFHSITPWHYARWARRTARGIAKLADLEFSNPHPDSQQPDDAEDPPPMPVRGFYDE